MPPRPLYSRERHPLPIVQEAGWTAVNNQFVTLVYQMVRPSNKNSGCNKSYAPQCYVTGKLPVLFCVQLRNACDLICASQPNSYKLTYKTRVVKSAVNVAIFFIMGKQGLLQK
jgi:hypothetical protein